MTRSRNDDPVVINASQIHETEAGVLLLTDDDKEVWFPKSQLVQISDNEWQMPEWLAMDKGVI
jgi:hypothetical protein